MRLIDVDALKKIWEDDECSLHDYTHLHFIESIDEQPTIDAEPVRHGKLIDIRTDELYEQWGDCSLCGERNYADAKYCQWCGAKLDGGEANGN